MPNLSHKISNNRKLLTQIQHFMQQYYQLYQRRSQSPTTLTDDPSLDLRGIYLFQDIGKQELGFQLPNPS